MWISIVFRTLVICESKLVKQAVFEEMPASTLPFSPASSVEIASIFSMVSEWPLRAPRSVTRASNFVVCEDNIDESQVAAFSCNACTFFPMSAPMASMTWPRSACS